MSTPNYPAPTPAVREEVAGLGEWLSQQLDADATCPACHHPREQHLGYWCRVEREAINAEGRTLICCCAAVDRDEPALRRIQAHRKILGQWLGSVSAYEKVVARVDSGELSGPSAAIQPVVAEAMMIAHRDAVETLAEVYADRPGWQGGWA
jgi:hypothetical protein